MVLSVVMLLFLWCWYHRYGGSQGPSSLSWQCVNLQTARMWGLVHTNWGSLPFWASQLSFQTRPLSQGVAQPMASQSRPSWGPCLVGSTGHQPLWQGSCWFCITPTWNPAGGGREGPHPGSMRLPVLTQGLATSRQLPCAISLSVAAWYIAFDNFVFLDCSFFGRGLLKLQTPWIWKCPFWCLNFFF